MADNTKIEWADATVNYVNGCSVISAGCTNCYAMRLAGTRLKHDPSRAGLTRDTKAGPVWTGEVRANEKMLLQPLAWKRPRRIFWNAHGDLFHENVPDAWIDRQFAVMALTPQHTHMVLTKRPERMREYLERSIGRIADAVQPLRTDNNRAVGPLPHIEPGARWWPLPNVWLGTSVEDQRAADERIPHLLATPAAVRFLSCEPLLGPVDLTAIPVGNGVELDAFAGWHSTSLMPFIGESPSPLHQLPILPVSTGKIHWVIAGGESGPGARPMHPDWARSLRDQCAAAGVAFHFKQWGEWGPVEIDADGHLHPPVSLSEPNGSPMLWRRWDGTDTRPPWKGEKVNTWFAPGTFCRKVGKARAGRLLDGRTHDDFPGSLSHG